MVVVRWRGMRPAVMLVVVGVGVRGRCTWGKIVVGGRWVRCRGRSWVVGCRSLAEGWWIGRCWVWLGRRGCCCGSLR